MAINKIIVDGVTKIDLSQDTVTADKVLEGVTFHDATGSSSVGTMTGGGVDVGDLTLYTKYAYNYDDFVSNGSAPQVTVYDENYTPISCWYVRMTGSEINAFLDYAPELDSSNNTVYVVSTKKISNIDVNLGGGCGC